MKIVVFFFIILLTSLSLYFNQFNNNYKVIDSNPSFIVSSIDDNIRIGDIIKYNSNARYIIAQRIVTNLYKCPDYSNPVIYFNKLEYIIVDKNKNIIYSTDNENIFNNKIQELETGLSLIYVNNISSKYKTLVEKSKQVLSSENLKSCEDNTYKKFLLLK